MTLVQVTSVDPVAKLQILIRWPCAITAVFFYTLHCTSLNMREASNSLHYDVHSHWKTEVVQYSYMAFMLQRVTHILVVVVVI